MTTCYKMTQIIFWVAQLFFDRYIIKKWHKWYMHRFACRASYVLRPLLKVSSSQYACVWQHLSWVLLFLGYQKDQLLQKIMCKSETCKIMHVLNLVGFLKLKIKNLCEKLGQELYFYLWLHVSFALYMIL